MEVHKKKYGGGGRRSRN